MIKFADIENEPISIIFNKYNNDIDKEILLECKNKDLEKFNKIYLESVKNNNTRLVEIFLSHCSINPDKKIDYKIKYTDGTDIMNDMLKRSNKIRENNPNQKIISVFAQPDIEGNNKDNYYCPLSICSILGNEDVAKLLIKYGADVNNKDSKNWTPLHLAAFNKNKNIIEILVNTGLANINTKSNYGETPILIATRKQDIECVKFLMDNNADVNIYSNEGYNPLVWATKFQNIDLVNLLLEKTTTCMDNVYMWSKSNIELYKLIEKRYILNIENNPNFEANKKLFDQYSPPPFTYPNECKIQ